MAGRKTTMSIAASSCSVSRSAPYGTVETGTDREAVGTTSTGPSVRARFHNIGSASLPLVSKGRASGRAARSAAPDGRTVVPSARLLKRGTAGVRDGLSRPVGRNQSDDR